LAIGSQRKLKVFIGLAFTFTIGLNAWGQSGTRVPAAPPRAIVQGSGTAKNEASIAMSGYCPVCIVEMRQWVQGDNRFAVVQDGKTYLFPSDEQKQMFLKDPNKYTPAFGGSCTVCRVEMQKVVPGTPEFTVFRNNMRYWFPSDDQLKMFIANPTKYEAN
jgi:YHS domain-containing protein